MTAPRRNIRARAVAPLAGNPPPLPSRATYLPSVRGIRGLPVDGDAPERRRPATPLSRVVARILDRHNIRLPDNIDTLLEDWPDLAGPGLAERVRPGKCERNILYVYARNSTEIFELRRFKLRELEARIRRHPRYKHIRQVRLQLDPG